MTPQDRLAELLEVIAVPSNRGRLTHSWVSQNISFEAADQVFAAIKAVSEPTALRFAAGDGVDTTAATWKQQAEAVAEAIPSLAPHLETLRDFETVRIPRWQAEGYETEPTLESVTAELLSQEHTAARETISTAISHADAARFASEQSGASGEDCIAAWLAKINEVLG